MLRSVFSFFLLRTFPLVRYLLCLWREVGLFHENGNNKEQSLWLKQLKRNLKILTPWKKSCDKDIILKSRDITLPTTVCIVKAMVFPVVMNRCEIWTIKKIEHLRIDAFEIWCWRRHLRVPWTARRSNQSILKEINHEFSLEGLLLKLQYFGHLM